MPGTESCLAYLHGFASGPLSTKGQDLAARLARRGVELRLPDLNRPSFARLTVTGALEAVDEMVAAGAPEASWRFIGSSFGGYVAARWAELRPERVDRLLLLCPGFDLASRWPHLLGAEEFARWERDGELLLPDGAGHPTPVHWGFVQDARRHPPFPVVPCPTRIVHGTRDEVVLVEGSRRYAAGRPDVELIEVDDDHALLDSMDAIAGEAEAFLLSS
ncbi:MAG: YqiA/YcfP family alpha/beta fold hydrolase [Thermoanaerobaculia bacterium]